MSHLLPLRLRRRSWAMGHVCGSLPDPEPHWRPCNVYPIVGIGRYEGPKMCLGLAENPPNGLCHRCAHNDRTSRGVWCSHVTWAPASGKQFRTRYHLTTTPGSKAGKKEMPRPGEVCPLTTGGLPRNCSSGVRATSESPRAFGPTHRPRPWPGASSSGPPGPGNAVHRPPYSGVHRPCRASAACRASEQAYAPWP
jgi:hypothetical protein